MKKNRTKKHKRSDLFIGGEIEHVGLLQKVIDAAPAAWGIKALKGQKNRVEALIHNMQAESAAFVSLMGMKADGLERAEYLDRRPRTELLTLLAKMPDEAFLWLVAAIDPSIPPQVWPDGLGGFHPASRDAIVAVRRAAMRMLT